MKNERTSKLIAARAAAVLAARTVFDLEYESKDGTTHTLSGAQVRSIMASVVTQAPDRTVKRGRARMRNPKGLKGGRRR